MDNKKSKLPELNEVANAATKIFKDLSRSVKEIYQDYKTKREEPAKADEQKKAKVKTAKKPTKKD